MINRIFRLCYFCYLKLARKNLSVGNNVRIDIQTKIDNRANTLVLGNNVYLRSMSKGYHAAMPFPSCILMDKKDARVEIGDNCRINGTYIHAQKSIKIGKNTVIAAGTQIIDTNGHETISTDRTKGRDTPQAIEIGENVWIGLNSIILKGTSIGKNSVVGANSVVKGSFPDNSLILGNPATLVKKLEIDQ